MSEETIFKVGQKWRVLNTEDSYIYPITEDNIVTIKRVDECGDGIIYDSCTNGHSASFIGEDDIKKGYIELVEDDSEETQSESNKTQEGSEAVFQKGQIWEILDKERSNILPRFSDNKVLIEKVSAEGNFAYSATILDFNDVRKGWVTLVEDNYKDAIIDDYYLEENTDGKDTQEQPEKEPREFFVAISSNATTIHEEYPDHLKKHGVEIIKVEECL